MSERLELHVRNAMANVVGEEHGISEAELAALQEKADDVHQQLTSRRDAGELPFFNLPYEKELAEEILRFASDMRGSFANYVHVGIGGSSLGPKAVHRAMLHPFHNELPDDERSGPRIYYLENPDPDTVAGLLDFLDVSRTLFNIVTKSGSTAETAAIFLVVADALQKAMGPKWKQNLVFTTDPEQGDLRALAREEHILTFSIDPGVGGRFSVLTPVGLLPAAVAGIDIRAMLAGAADMDRRCQSADLRDNPAYQFAALHYLANQRHGKPQAVMMPYADCLYDLADWFRQLWAESLGKARDLNGREVQVGQTPIKALGAVDQHSQVQLYIEGPNDKLFTFLRVEQFRREVKIAPNFGAYRSYGYLGGKSLNQLLNVEQQATAEALAAHQRPNLTLVFPKVTPGVLGQFFFMLEVATAFSGGLYHIDPFDQPGVEHGKKLTYRMMGRDE
ncbi:MAG: glucose-6-phosphate isomerase [candidate division KSB1 bacterium]|nr:glucose-6-phosphate isomerase [candidate division KSB1 bacterium]